MAGTRSALRTARLAVVMFALLLGIGTVASWSIGTRTLSAARTQATTDAGTVTGTVIAGIITSSDLTAPVAPSRAREIDDALQKSGFSSTGFDKITIWLEDGTVVYSTDRNLLAARVPSETSRIRLVLRDGATSEVDQGTFATFVPLTAGTADAVAELDRPYASITERAQPLRLATGLLLILFLCTLYIVYRLS
ncbi:MAG: hypothetical protein HY240_00295, partial [Actinobacteria bacterium]|nr:hypothetical protein [Actinomycetota bacterium]